MSTHLLGFGDFEESYVGGPGVAPPPVGRKDAKGKPIAPKQSPKVKTSKAKTPAPTKSRGLSLDTHIRVQRQAVNTAVAASQVAKKALAKAKTFNVAHHIGSMEVMLGALASKILTPKQKAAVAKAAKAADAQAKAVAKTVTLANKALQAASATAKGATKHGTTFKSAAKKVPKKMNLRGSGVAATKATVKHLLGEISPEVLASDPELAAEVVDFLDEEGGEEGGETVGAGPGYAGDVATQAEVDAMSDTDWQAYREAMIAKTGVDPATAPPPDPNAAPVDPNAPPVDPNVPADPSLALASPDLTIPDGAPRSALGAEAESVVYHRVSEVPGAVVYDGQKGYPGGTYDDKSFNNDCLVSHSLVYGPGYGYYYRPASSDMVWRYTSDDGDPAQQFPEVKRGYHDGTPNAANQYGVKYGWGPIIGNPRTKGDRDWTHGLKYAMDDNKYFWFRNDAPKWATAVEDAAAAEANRVAAIAKKAADDAAAAAAAADAAAKAKASADHEAQLALAQHDQDAASTLAESAAASAAKIADSQAQTVDTQQAQQQQAQDIVYQQQQDTQQHQQAQQDFAYGQQDLSERQGGFQVQQRYQEMQAQDTQQMLDYAKAHPDQYYAPDPGGGGGSPGGRRGGGQAPAPNYDDGSGGASSMFQQSLQEQDAFSSEDDGGAGDAGDDSGGFDDGGQVMGDPPSADDEV